MLFTTCLLYYLEEYEGKNKLGSHADFRDSLHNKNYYSSPCDDLTILFYTLLLVLRITLMLVAVFESSRDQAKRSKPNFCIVFLSFWLPEIYLVIHAATGWHTESDVFTS